MTRRSDAPGNPPRYGQEATLKLISFLLSCGIEAKEVRVLGGIETVMEQGTRFISEAEYVAHFERVRHRLARMIAFSGLTLSEIARGTRLKWDTVYAASQGRPVRMENAARIQYFLDKYRETGTEV